jgi:LysM repeat protein
MKKITCCSATAVVILTLALSAVAAGDVAATYKVKAGDTACGIAERHNIPCSRLIKKNNLGSNAAIFPGQILYLPDSALWNDSMPCQIRVISWVDVIVQGNRLTDKKADFEKLIRRVLKRDVPSLSHEVTEYGALWSQVSYDEVNEKFLDIDVGKDERFIRRAEVNCRIWTSGSEDPIAVYMICELSGWGNYNPQTYNEFKLEALSTAAASTLPGKAEAMLSGLLSSVGERLLKYRKKDCPATLE